MILEMQVVFSVAIFCSPVRLPLAPIVPRGFTREMEADAATFHDSFDMWETFNSGLYFGVDIGSILVI